MRSQNHLRPSCRSGCRHNSALIADCAIANTCAIKRGNALRSIAACSIAIRIINSGGNIIKKNIQPRADLKAIGRRIRELRGIDHTQAEFGKLLGGIAQAQLSKYEKGQNAPTLEVLLALKAYSGKSIDWFVTGEDIAAKK